MILPPRSQCCGIRATAICLLPGCDRVEQASEICFSIFFVLDPGCSRFPALDPMMPCLALLMLHGGRIEISGQVLRISVWRCIPGEAATMADWGSEVELPGPEKHRTSGNPRETARNKAGRLRTPRDRSWSVACSTVRQRDLQLDFGTCPPPCPVCGTISEHAARLRSGGLCLQLARLRSCIISAPAMHVSAFRQVPFCSCYFDWRCGHIWIKDLQMPGPQQAVQNPLLFQGLRRNARHRPLCACGVRCICLIAISYVPLTN